MQDRSFKGTRSRAFLANHDQCYKAVLTLLRAAAPLVEVASQQDEVSDSCRARAGALARFIGQEGSAPMAAAKKSTKGG